MAGHVDRLADGGDVGHHVAEPTGSRALSEQGGRLVERLVGQLEGPPMHRHDPTGAEILERLPKAALLVDLAAPPGGIDFDTAQRLGLKAIWGRGLGSRAPVTVGASQWGGIRQRIESILRAP